MNKRSMIYEYVQSSIALIIVLAFCIVLGWAVVRGFPPAREGDQGLYILLGALTSTVGTVAQTYFRQRDARVNDTSDPRRPD